MLDLDWLCRATTCRAVRLTDIGRAGLAGTFGVTVEHDNPAARASH